MSSLSISLSSLALLLVVASAVASAAGFAVTARFRSRVGRAPEGVSFSEATLGVVQRAEQEARLRGAAPISPEHILYALVADHSSVVATFLVERGVDVDALRDRLRALLPTGPQGPEQITPLYTARGAGVLVHALREAAERKSTHADLAELLAGVLRAGRSRARQLLRTSGVTLDSVRSARALGA